MDWPTVGRIVHYVAYGTPGGEFPAGVCRAAVITEVQSERTAGYSEQGTPYVAICVMNPSGLFFNQQIPYSARPLPGSWHWPERDVR